MNRRERRYRVRKERARSKAREVLTMRWVIAEKVCQRCGSPICPLCGDETCVCECCGEFNCERCRVYVERPLVSLS